MLTIMLLLWETKRKDIQAVFWVTVLLYVYNKAQGY